MNPSGGFMTLVPPPADNELPAATSFAAFPTASEAADSSSSDLERIYSKILNQQISRVISAYQGTTLFTAITPLGVTQAETSSTTTTTEEQARSTTTAATAVEENISSTPITLSRVTDIGIAFGIFVVLTVIIVGIVLCIRHKKSSKPRKNEGQNSLKSLDSKEWQQTNLSAPSIAHLPRDSVLHPPRATGNPRPEHNNWMPPPAYPSQQPSYPRGGYR
ncbi:hypothetical protein B0J13DRAFT_296933 [Dactylonectria estremocensis]|uniref:Uncharacterized protein n=1 Tax=Dactylonectria estremocensis TaxID=1079267 RepID=A0A9P9F104_9HYPO|nr:hypothetical protein B0J13DRAFT_296933 [Dactylonectria estremocensis]